MTEAPDYSNPNHYPEYPEEEWKSETLREWLIANGVNWDRVVAWPDLAVDDSTIYVEMFKYGPNDQPEICHGPDVLLTHIVQVPHTVKVDPEFLAAYNHSRPKALEQRKRDSLLRWLLHHPPAVMVGRGQTLIFVGGEEMQPEDQEAVQKHLQAQLTGVNVVIVTGVSQIIAGPTVRVAA